MDCYSSSYGDLSSETSSLSTNVDSLDWSTDPDDPKLLFANKVLARDWLQAALVEATTLNRDLASESKGKMSRDDLLLLTDLLEVHDGNAFYPKCSYLAQAAHYVKVACEYEESKELENAFYAYKSCIEILLKGVITEKDSDKRACVSEKVTEYITIASQILLNSIQPFYSDEKVWSEGYFSSNTNFDHLVRPSNELNTFRVFKLLNKSMVVFDDLGAKYALKLLPKSFNENWSFKNFPPQMESTSNICGVYELPHAYVFCLEYIVGDLLISRMQPSHNFSETNEIPVSTYQDTSQSSEVNEQRSRCETGSFHRDHSSNTITDLSQFEPRAPSSLESSFEKSEKSLAELLFAEPDSDNSDFALTLTEEELRKSQTPTRKAPVRPVVSSANFVESFVAYNAAIHNNTRNKRRSMNMYTIPVRLLQKWIAQMVQYLNEIHSLGIFWGCLTPRDIFLHRNGNIKFKHCFSWLYDSVEIDQKWLSDRYCVNFIAPELLDDVIFMKPNSKSDLWSLGAVLYTLITGRLFVEDYPSYSIEEVDKFDLPSEFDSPSLQNLLFQLLQQVPTRRLNFENAKDDSFFNILSFPEI